jgi:O-antigen ligase
MAVFLFVMQLFLALVFSSGDFSFHFYGTSGRNTGFLAYLSLCFLLLASASSSTKKMLENYCHTLIGVGGVIGIYGLGQSQGLDFIEYVSSYASTVFGTFGNPNFHSAFMGMVVSATTTLAVFSSLRIPFKIGLIALSFIGLVNIAFSSEQGYLNFICGIASAFIIFLFKKKGKRLGWASVGVSGFGMILVLAGIFNVGPLSDFLYKTSLQARGFYWQAAVSMIIEKPFFGVGLDGFGDWYRRSRSQNAAETNLGVVSDSAHNIPLDIGSGGGIPLLALYFLIIGLALIAIVRVLIRQDEFDVFFASIVSAWVAYQAQSLISINQLGLGVWGWSLTGLLIGYELNTREIQNSNNGKKWRTFSTKGQQTSGGFLIVTVVAGAIGAAVALPPYIAADKYFRALQSSNVDLLYESTYLKPYDKSRFLFTAQILNENSLNERAIQILRDASKLYPDSFELWQRWAQISTATPKEIAKAKAELKRLDPFNPAWQ